MFGDKCDNLHVIKDNLKESYEKVLEDLLSIKAELDLLKKIV